MAYGFEIRDNSGNIAVDQSDAQLYVISRHYVPQRSTSYIYEPNFDINDGEWIIKQHFTTMKSFSGGLPVNYVAFDSYTDQSQIFSYTNAVNGIAGLRSNLEFNWDNTSKIFSWTAPSLYAGDTWMGIEIYSGYAVRVEQGNFEVVFMRYG